MDCNFVIFDAVKAGDLSSVRRYLHARNSVDPVRAADGYTPLMVTCESLVGHPSQLPIAKTLLDNGANPNLASRRDCANALHIACRESIFGGDEGKTNESLIKLLISFGANMNITDLVGSVLHQAAIVGNQLVIRLALDAGIDKEIRDSGGRTALNVAGAACPYYGTLNMLVKSGCDLRSVDDKGRNFLHQAIIHRNVAAVKFAIEHGMLPYKDPDSEGKSPQDYFFDMSALPRQIFPVHFGHSMLEYMNDPQWERTSVREWERRKKKPGFLAVRQSSSMERAIKRSIRCRIYNEDPSKFRRRADSTDDSYDEGEPSRRRNGEDVVDGADDDYANRKLQQPMRHNANSFKAKRGSQHKGVDKDQRIRQYLNNARVQEIIDGLGKSQQQRSHSKALDKRSSPEVSFDYDCLPPSPLPWFDPTVPPPFLGHASSSAASSPLPVFMETPEPSPVFDTNASKSHSTSGNSSMFSFDFAASSGGVWSASAASQFETSYNPYIDDSSEEEWQPSFSNHSSFLAV